MNETRSKVKRQIWIWGNRGRKKGNDFRRFTRKILVESTEMCYDMSVGKIYMQIWFIGRTLASQAGKAGSTPVICFVHLLKKRESRYPIGFHAFSNYIFSQQCCCFYLSRTPNHFRAFQMPSLSTSVVI